jgi:hypothetical protein
MEGDFYSSCATSTCCGSCGSTGGGIGSEVEPKSYFLAMADRLQSSGFDKFQVLVAAPSAVSVQTLQK